MSATTILLAVAKLTRPLTIRDVRGLSGMTYLDRRDFLEIWQSLPAERRTTIARELIELAEEHVELAFGELWSWLLDDREAAVRISAIEGLWEDTSTKMLRRMVDIFTSDASTDVRAAAAIGLSRFACLAALGELAEGEEALEQALSAAALDTGLPTELRRRALESAGYFAENEQIQNQVERDYASGEQLLAESALVAMGRSMLPRWLPVIGKALGHESPALRYEACRAAGELADEAQPLLPKIFPLVTDSDSEIALAAIWALGQIGGEQAERALKQVSRSSDTARSQAAAEALEELSGGDSLV
ncbi:HEAT repeat domain-containing protein [Chloroflexia bacterium SDU3-3]|nr:HEAT repeat domain-containing protein [Chloroflexia bacterium SDU3-3]